MSRAPTTDRERYAALRQAQNQPSVLTLEKELAALHTEIASVEVVFGAAIQRATHRPESWLLHFYPPALLRRRAGTEFDAMLRSPYLSAVALTSKPEALQLSVDATTSVEIRLLDGGVALEPLSAHATHARVLAAAVRVLVAAGNLRDALALVASAVGAHAAQSTAPAVAPGTRAAYIRERVRRLQASIQDAAGDGADLAEMSWHDEQLIQRALVTERALARARKRCAQPCDALVHEFDLLHDLPGVCSVSVNNDTVSVQSEPICIQHDGVKYAIGRFSIEISPRQSAIRMRNLDRRVGYYHHPHVYESGQVCWGGVRPHVAQLLAAGDIPAIVQQSLELLRTCNRRREYLEILHMFPVSAT